MKLSKFRCLMILLILASPSCQQPSQHSSASKVIKINLATEPPCLDVKKITDSQSQFFAMMCQDGLTRKNLNQEIELSLAKSLKISDNQKTYLFSLRSCLWSDGKALTAYDFLNSYLALLHPEFPSSYAYLFFDIEGAKEYKEGILPKDAVGIRALDALSLEIKLHTPNPHFLEILSSVHFYPYPDSVAKHNESFV